MRIRKCGAASGMARRQEEADARPVAAGYHFMQTLMPKSAIRANKKIDYIFLLC